jgi:hypothetical protein
VVRTGIALGVALLALGCDAGKKAPPHAVSVVPADAEVVDPTLPHFDGARRVAGRAMICAEARPCTLYKDGHDDRLLDRAALANVFGDRPPDFTKEVGVAVRVGPWAGGRREVASWWRRGETLILDAKVTRPCRLDEARMGPKYPAEPTVFVVAAAGVTKLEAVDREVKVPCPADPPPVFEGATQVVGVPLSCEPPCSLAADAQPAIIRDPKTAKRLLGTQRVDFKKQVVVIAWVGEAAGGSSEVVSWWKRGDELFADVLVKERCTVDEDTWPSTPRPVAFVVDAVDVTDFEPRTRYTASPRCD